MWKAKIFMIQIGCKDEKQKYPKSNYLKAHSKCKTMELKSKQRDPTQTGKNTEPKSRVYRSAARLENIADITKEQTASPHSHHRRKKMK